MKPETELTYGDVLKYPDGLGGGAWRFMFIGGIVTPDGTPYNRILVVAIEEDDDQWVPGKTILTAGIREMELADD